jgi:hypothetical protein
MNVSHVLDYSLTIHASTIRFGLYDTVRETAHISADLGRGTSDFSPAHLLPFNQPDYSHKYSPYYGLSGEATSTKFVRYWARNSQNLI